MKPGVARLYVCQIILALDYLHENKIVHGDLKPENLLISANGYIKVAYFGLARRAIDHSPLNLIFGTVYYMAPEMINGSFFGPSIDWWALGVILYQTLFARYPFDLDRSPNPDPRFSRDDQNRVKLLSTSPTRRLLDRALISNEYVYFLGVEWEKVLNQMYELTFKPNDIEVILAKTSEDYSSMYANPPKEKQNDQFTGLFDDFYYKGPGSPW
ncbi:hypothetical protein PtB15_12B243 [Puccinia triticina]|nr:hypothetical protein PtB15_12B243 [Puccinia triticina]